MERSDGNEARSCGWDSGFDTVCNDGKPADEKYTKFDGPRCGTSASTPSGPSRGICLRSHPNPTASV